MTEVKYYWTEDYDEEIPCYRNYRKPEKIIFENDEYSFADYLRDHNIKFITKDEIEFLVINDFGELTGERYALWDTKKIK